MRLCYRVTEPVKRIAMTMRHAPDDRRVPEIDEGYFAQVRESVRTMRLGCLQQTWDERQLSAFDHLVVMFHKWDPKLYLCLSGAPRDRAEAILEREGWI